jgi:hypothetical protein
MVIKMTQISISNLSNQDEKSLLFFLEDTESASINLAISRALEARKISGGMIGSDFISKPGPTCGMTCGGITSSSEIYA